MQMFALILLLPAAITIMGKALGAIPSNRGAAIWILASGCTPALIYWAIMVATGGVARAASIVSSPVVIVTGIAVAWLGLAAWPSGWYLRR